jgi:hypothetical protein
MEEVDKRKPRDTAGDPMVNDNRPDIHFRPNRRTKRLMWMVSAGAAISFALAIAFVVFTPERPVPDTPATPPIGTRTPDVPRPSPGPPSEPALPTPQR